jgi:hypothetical protein
MNKISKSVLFITFLLFSVLSQNYLLKSQCYNNSNANVWGTSSNVGIQSFSALKKLNIGGNNTCPDVALQLEYGGEILNSFAILALTTFGNYQSYTTLATNPVANGNIGDLILSGMKSKDILITARDSNGNIRFATTEANQGPDIERMLIAPNGKIGISCHQPKNLMSVRNSAGIDYWNDNELFQDIRFNCYHGPSEKDSEEEKNETDSSYGDGEVTFSSEHKNISTGHASIIQSKSASYYGSLLLAVSASHDNPDEKVEFFEYYGMSHSPHPMGIMIQNYNEYSNIGLGNFPDPLSRVTIRGRTANDSMLALNVVNSNDYSLFVIRNDGNIGIGVSNPGEKFVVDGLICAKEVRVQLTGEPCWGDYVFDDKYQLMPLPELESTIKENKHLPGVPTAKEIESNGLQIGEMQAIMMKKIEELTLYVIDLQKQCNDLKKQLEDKDNGEE